LAIHLEGVSKERIAVMLTPADETGTTPKLTSLSEWRAQ
jgi:hypothetical protein